MSIVRPATPPELPSFSLANVTTASNAGRAVRGLSRDRRTFYGIGLDTTATQQTLYESVNSGGTWTAIKQFPEQVIGMLELDDGEMLVTTQNGAATPGYIYRSSGFAASHTGATWTKTLTTLGGYIVPQWGLHQWSAAANGVVVVNEYGPQTTSSGDQTTKARRVFLSTDFGATWTMIFDIYTQPQAPNPVGVHMHAAAYDPEWDRIWITFGDNTGGAQAIAGAGNNYVAYSDDRGATWTYLPWTTEYQASIQPTTIAILEEALLLMPDSEPYGVMVLPKAGYRKLGGVRIASLFAGGTGAQGIALGAFRSPAFRGAPCFVGMQTSTATAPTAFVCGDGGLRWEEIWRDDTNKVANQGITFFGPDLFGKVLGDYRSLTTGGATYGSTVTADLMAAEQKDNQVGGVATFSGDGTTTTFLIPHGLGVKPTRYTAEAASAGAATPFYRTVDATNITVTFTTAPATGTGNVLINWTAGL